MTLTGTGGVGKTRLGMQVANEMIHDFGDGVFFIPLAPVSDPTLVVATITRTLGIKETGERPLLDLLEAHVPRDTQRDKRRVCKEEKNVPP